MYSSRVFSQALSVMVLQALDGHNSMSHTSPIPCSSSNLLISSPALSMTPVGKVTSRLQSLDDRLSFLGGCRSQIFNCLLYKDIVTIFRCFIADRSYQSGGRELRQTDSNNNSPGSKINNTWNTHCHDNHMDHWRASWSPTYFLTILQSEYCYNIVIL